MLARQASAKINLYLRVRGKRPDGYHELETLLQEIDLADTLIWQPETGPFTLCVEQADLGPIDQNLVYRAAMLYRQITGYEVSGQVSLRKQIPAGAGLGGGSSDAAAMLSLLNAYFGSPLTLADLEQLAVTLGSDVPFFLHGGTQLGKGRGEVLSPYALAATVPRQGFLFLPGIHMSSGEVFGRLKGRYGGVGEAAIGENDLLEAAREASPEFANIYDALARVTATTNFFMTGSGSSMVLLSEATILDHAVMAVCLEQKVEVVPFRFFEG